MTAFSGLIVTEDNRGVVFVNGTPMLVELPPDAPPPGAYDEDGKKTADPTDVDARIDAVLEKFGVR